MPLTNVTTAITAATPMTTPSKVSTERSLFAHSDCNAMRMASPMFINRTSDLRPQTLDLKPQRRDQSNSEFGDAARHTDARSLMSEVGGPRSDACSFAYNDSVGSWTGRPLLSRQVMREESPNSTEQCAG